MRVSNLGELAFCRFFPLPSQENVESRCVLQLLLDHPVKGDGRLFPHNVGISDFSWACRSAAVICLNFESNPIQAVHYEDTYELELANQSEQVVLSAVSIDELRVKASKSIGEDNDPFNLELLSDLPEDLIKALLVLGGRALVTRIPIGWSASIEETSSSVLIRIVPDSGVRNTDRFLHAYARKLTGALKQVAS